jgi:hypothetical protein
MRGLLIGLVLTTFVGIPATATVSPLDTSTTTAPPITTEIHNGDPCDGPRTEFMEGWCD